MMCFHVQVSLLILLFLD